MGVISDKRSALRLSRGEKSGVFIRLCMTLFTVCCLTLITTVQDTRAAIVTDAVIRCSYNPANGLPNPLGDREFITITQIDGSTYVSYQQLPEAIAAGVNRNGLMALNLATIELHRKIVFHQTGIQEAREIMRINDTYYHQLLGYETSVGYEAYDKTLGCSS